jgi:hypothetical protein
VKGGLLRGKWSRLIFTTKGKEEELSFSCRVQVGAATVHQKLPTEPEQPPEQRGNKGGGEFKPVRREGGPLQQQVQPPQPPSGGEEE